MDIKFILWKKIFYNNNYVYVFDTDICIVSWYMVSWHSATKRAIRLSESIELNKQSQLYSKHDVIITPKLFPGLLPLYEENTPVTGGFSAQKDSNMGIWCFPSY